MATRLAWDSSSRQERTEGSYERQRSADPYHTYRWTRLSRAFRNEPEHSLCAICKSNGIVKSADVVDHIVPWPICGLDGFFDRKNLQALCSKCNVAKGNRDKRIIQEWKRKQNK